MKWPPRDLFPCPIEAGIASIVNPASLVVPLPAGGFPAGGEYFRSHPSCLTLFLPGPGWIIVEEDAHGAAWISSSC